MENTKPQTMVTKGDGRIVPFDPNKIVKVLRKVGAEEQDIAFIYSKRIKFFMRVFRQRKSIRSYLGTLENWTNLWLEDII